MTVRIIATPIAAKDLQPGDLWSLEGPEAWATAMDDHPRQGKDLYIRNNRPLPHEMQEYPVFLMRIEKEV